MSLHAMAPAGHDDHAAYTAVFTGARRTELDELLTHYPTKMAALLPALWMLQEDRGWVSPEGMDEVARVLDLTAVFGGDSRWNVDRTRGGGYEGQRSGDDRRGSGQA